MSGGHFQYKQYQLGYIADAIEQLIINNDSKELNQWGDPIGGRYSARDIEVFKQAVKYIQVAEVYANRIDWFVSGDDGEENFHRRLAAELAELNQRFE